MAGLEGLLAGRVLGARYLIEEVIGRGGMGAVYRALDERLGRRVAVKVITLAGGDPAGAERLRARFHREARAAAALPHHPNVVPVYDYGTDEALGLDYIVMELLRGADLATRLARSDPPPLGTALRILLQAARGLAVGHRAGLIHRDVKPGNIFLAESDQRELQVRVVDFGIAKLIDEDDTANQLTQDGRAPHSPAFASPEQLRGLTRLTAASDVFSLGAVGYLLLTGERPFSDADRNKMSLGMPVPAPVLRASQPAIPAEVEVIVQKCLAFDPNSRYADAGEMHEALDEAIRGLGASPVELYPETRVNPPIAAPPEPAEAEDHTVLAESEAPGVGALSDDERTRSMEPDDRTLVAPPPQRPAAGDLPSRAFPPRPPLERRRSRLGLVVWTVVLLALAAVAVWAWMESNRPPPVVQTNPAPPESIVDVGQATPVDIEPVQQPDALTALTFASDGNNRFAAQDYDSAAVLYRLAVAIAPDQAIYRRNLGLTLRRLGQHEEAVQHFRRATLLDPTEAMAQFDLGNELLMVGDTAGSIESLQRFLVTSATDEVRFAVARDRADRQLRAIRSVQASQAARRPPDSVQVDTTQDSIAPVIQGGF
jgi:serine/threonine protein kinase